MVSRDCPVLLLSRACIRMIHWPDWRRRKELIGYSIGLICPQLKLKPSFIHTRRCRDDFIVGSATSKGRKPNLEEEERAYRLTALPCYF
jgi:hypothetical protein